MPAQVPVGDHVALRSAASHQVGVRDLRSRLSHYLQLAAAGESVAIVSRGQVVAELRPPAPPAARPNTRGALRGQIWQAPDWQGTPEDLIDLMESGTP
jgi:antitoxin (DNA-binding transcriptional repressor) of toxin-antitoxin stability system